MNVVKGGSSDICGISIAFGEAFLSIALPRRGPIRRAYDDRFRSGLHPYKMVAASRV
jgi:hypothetical protein